MTHVAEIRLWRDFNRYILNGCTDMFDRIRDSQGSSPFANYRGNAPRGGLLGSKDKLPKK